MDVIPPVNPIFYVFLFLTFLLLVLTLIVLVRSKRARRVKALFFGCACCLQIVTIAYPIYLYSNKPAPLGSPAVLIGQDPQGQIVALNARDGSVIWTQPMANQNASLIGGSGNLFYTVSQMCKIREETQQDCRKMLRSINFLLIFPQARPRYCLFFFCRRGIVPSPKDYQRVQRSGASSFYPTTMGSCQVRMH